MCRNKFGQYMCIYTYNLEESPPQETCDTIFEPSHHLWTPGSIGRTILTLFLHGI